MHAQLHLKHLISVIFLLNLHLECLHVHQTKSILHSLFKNINHLLVKFLSYFYKTGEKNLKPQFHEKPLVYLKKNTSLDFV